MNPYVTAQPNDTIPSTAVVFAGINFSVTFDFGGVFGPGVTIASATAAASNSFVAINTITYSGATVTFNLSSTSSWFQGQYCLLSAIVVASNGVTDGRTLQMVAYDKGTTQVLNPTNILIGTATLTPGTILDGEIIAPLTISVPGAVAGNLVAVVPNTALPNSVGVVFVLVSAAGVVSFQVQNLSGGSVTIGATLFTATVIN